MVPFSFSCLTFLQLLTHPRRYSSLPISACMYMVPDSNQVLGTTVAGVLELFRPCSAYMLANKFKENQAKICMDYMTLVVAISRLA